MTERFPLGFLASLDLRDMMRDLENEAKLECNLSHASRAVDADEMSG